MYPGSEPLVGEKIRLRGMVKSRDRPKIRQGHEVYVQEKHKSRKGSDKVVDNEGPSMHVVRKGETLYAIAGMYDQTVEVLLSRNALSNNLITPGQILYVD